ncbi:MAG: assimilatory nitrate reductase catalytic subunit [Candidatus Sumerlaeota bacterium]|nr:assimilatory nitrate reductase catalytic subunit [Candidatus Sumerlaeota bacterium]
MANPSTTQDEYIARYGPHVSDTPVSGWTADMVPDELVKTHCCFCGMQCGIQLAVKDNKVVGFEPWEEFPFNEGRLCPKGVKRYMQTHHPDRLTDPLIRTENGFRKATWDEALSLVVSRIKDIQARKGNNAFAMMSGVSLSNEKSYLVGKFARLALRTANLDYNGRFCMVSAGGGNKKAFGIDRTANSWEDIPKAKVIFLSGTNVSECFPTLTHYIWQARDNGAQLIVVDPRVTPIARTAEYHLAVRPGTDSALNQALLHELVRNDWIDHKFVTENCKGWEELKESVRECTPEWAGAICGVEPALIRRVAEVWGTAPTSFLMHARGIEQHTKGVENVLGLINLVLATGRIGREGCGYGTITGQGNGQGGREHGHKCDQLPGNRDIENPEHRAHICKVWGITDDELPHKGKTAVEIFEAIHEGEIAGLINICCNPLVSHPDTNYVREAVGKMEFFCVIDFFMSETARYADVILPGSLHEEEEGTSTTAEARVVRIRAAVTPPANARTDTEILLEIARRLDAEDKFTYADNRAIFEELRAASKGGTADYAGITWERIEKEMGVFWPCPEIGHPGTRRLFENGRSYHPDGKFHLHPTPYRPSFEVPDAEYPLYYTTGRSVYHYLSGTQTRRIKFLVEKCPGPVCEMHPMLAEKLGFKERQIVTLETRRGSITVPLRVTEGIRPDTVFVPYHWAERLAANQLTVRALDPISKMPEFKVAACRVRAANKEEADRLRAEWKTLIQEAS